MTSHCTRRRMFVECSQPFPATIPVEHVRLSILLRALARSTLDSLAPLRMTQSSSTQATRGMCESESSTLKLPVNKSNLRLRLTNAFPFLYL